MLPCTEDDRLCEDGSVCLAGASGARVCYLGGDVAIGEVCADSGDCVPGSVCVSEGAEARCRSACDTRRPSCVEGQMCVVLEPPRGYCGAAE